MEKVYIVYACDDWDWSVDRCVLSVHLTKEGADKAKDKYNRDCGSEHDWAVVEEAKVNP